VRGSSDGLQRHHVRAAHQSGAAAPDGGRTPPVAVLAQPAGVDADDPERDPWPRKAVMTMLALQGVTP